MEKRSFQPCSVLNQVVLRNLIGRSHFLSKGVDLMRRTGREGSGSESSHSATGPSQIRDVSQHITIPLLPDTTVHLRTMADLAHARAQHLIARWEQEGQPATRQVDPDKLVKKHQSIVDYARLQKERGETRMARTIFERMPASRAGDNIGAILTRELNLDSQISDLEQGMQRHEERFPTNAQIEVWRQESNPYLQDFRGHGRRMAPASRRSYEKKVREIQASPQWSDPTVQHWNREYHRTLLNEGRDGSAIRCGSAHLPLALGTHVYSLRAVASWMFPRYL